MGPAECGGQGLQLGPLGFLFAFDSIWVGRERPPAPWGRGLGELSGDSGGP